MGLWSSLVSWVSGEDTANEAAGNAADVANQAINQKLLEQGLLTQAQYDSTVQDFAQGNADTGTANPQAAITGEFDAGLAQGANNILSAPGKVVGAVGDASGSLLWGILKAIPWWVWIGGLVALFVWMGGLALLRGQLKGRLAPR
jgi:hypothetical protein